MSKYDYVKNEKKVEGELSVSLYDVCVLICTDDDMKGDPLRGINVDAAGGAGKVLKMLAEKVSSTRSHIC